LDTEVLHLEDAARELDERMVARQEETARTENRRVELRGAIAETERLLDDDAHSLDELRIQVREADESVLSSREAFGANEAEIRGARHRLEAVRADVMQHEVARVSASSDLTHLAETCMETVNASIEEVVEEVARM